MAKARSDIVAALDVGSTKTACLIGREDDQGVLEVIGAGQQRTGGVRSGAIVDMEATRTSILSAVHMAEQMAEETIRDVWVNLSTGAPRSDAFAVEVAIAGHEVSQADVRKVLEQGRMLKNGDDRELIHSIPVGFRIDDNNGIRDPRGMYGDRLGVEMHLVTAATGPVRNVATCVGGCHLEVAAFVVAPLAAGMAVMVEDEMTLGTTLIDLGGGTTSIAVFEDGELVYTDCLPIGGQHVTMDIAHGLSTTLGHAERIKTVYGSAIAQASDDRAIIDVPPIGEEDETPPNHVPKSLLVSIIQPRVEEILELVRARLDARGYGRGASRRVVLTGGASQLRGLPDLAAQVLNKQVRIGRPTGLKGLPQAVAGPAFATCAGLLVNAGRRDSSAPVKPIRRRNPPRNLAGRIGHWLQENI